MNYGIKEFTLSINHKSEIIKAFFSELKPKYKIKYIEEKKPLGTVGSLRNLSTFSENDLFLINCDVIYKLNLYLIGTIIQIIVFKVAHYYKN